MRERLIELLKATGMVDNTSRCEIIAEELLCKGVIVLPCNVGDTVYCDIKNEGKGYFDECKIHSIEFDKDFEEPLFTAVCREKAEYQTYWASDFGKTIFHEPQFIIDKKPKKARKEKQ